MLNLPTIYMQKATINRRNIIYLCARRTIRNRMLTFQLIRFEYESESSASPSSIDENDNNDRCDSSTTYEAIHRFRGQCPLTSCGVFGLTSKQHIRLCSSDKDKGILYLVSHFHRYHHLTWSISYKLTELVMRKCNPLTTSFFQAYANPIDKRFSITECPLKQISSFQHKSRCRKNIYKGSLKQHLLGCHHLTIAMTKKIIDAMKNEEDLNSINWQEKN
jgi:hypothetical protein